MDYNGLGQRLSMDAAGVIAHYVMDGDQPLTATSGGNTTFYLYGLGAIAEKTDAWSYSLLDGTNTPRQLADLAGGITLSARYTPWGDVLDTYGTGDFTFGYFGGLMDAVTGLLYVGNGQYYDPATGRFLTRDARPNRTNPYVPWNPIGAIVGPLGLIALVFGRRKKGSKWGTFLVLVLVVGSVGMTLAGCGRGNPAPPLNPTTPAPQIPPTQTPSPIPSETPSPTQTSNPTAPPSPTNTPFIDGDCGIPPAIYTYPCTPSSDKPCIDRIRDDAVVQIAHTVQGEGGAFSDQVAANVLQTIINRAFTYWVFTHHQGINPNNIPWEQINKEKLTDLLLFILSEPGGDGWPSYNAWRSRVPRSGERWPHIIDAVKYILDNPGVHPSSAVTVNQVRPVYGIISNTNVQWYGATTDPKWEPPKNITVVAIDTITRNVGDKEIFCQKQFYTLDVIRPPFEPGKNCP